MYVFKLLEASAVVRRFSSSFPRRCGKRGGAEGGDPVTG
jgi:hypothetical protein